jgi:NhaA family Na+:H+ antiporter
MATDIAFAVGALALVARGVPTSLKVFLLAVAIVDDLGAVIVIALFYTGHISGTALAIAGMCFALLVVMNAIGVHRPMPYLLIGVGLWAATLASGVHATVAGVLLGLTIPATRLIKEAQFITYMRRMLELFERDAADDSERITPNQGEALAGMEQASEAVQTPLARVEHALVRPVSLIIVPLFALANAGVNVRGGGASNALSSPILWGVALGLIVGKPIGIVLASWLAVRAGVAALPAGVNWRQMWGVGVLCGIGFTMSLFIANLAFAKEPALLGLTKMAVLTASTVAGVGGAVMIRLFGRSRQNPS